MTRIASLLAALACWIAASPNIFAASAEIWPVDISQAFTKTRQDFPPDRSWSSTPNGHQVLSGVPFDLEGVVELAGRDAARYRETFPGRQTGIRVGHKAAWIHLLHGTGFKEEDGTPIALIHLHYEDGSRADMAIAYGVHVRNWWKEPSDPTDSLSDRNSAVAWTGTSSETANAGIKLRLFRSSLPNPFPEKKIKTIDLRSLLTHATPVIVGLSVGGPPDLPGFFPDKNIAAGDPATQAAQVPIPSLKKTIIQVDDDSGQPIPNARLQLRFRDSGALYPFGDETTSSDGKATIEWPPTINRLELTIQASGFEAELQRLDLGRLDDVVSIELHKGSDIGGTIQDPKGNPVSGATVIIYGITDPWTGNAQQELAQTKSSTNGTWNTASVPSGMYKLAFEVKHPDFLTAQYMEPKPPMINRPPPPVERADLARHKAIFELHPGIRLAGAVKNLKGDPISGAQVVLEIARPPEQMPQVQLTPVPLPARQVASSTDEHGAFAFAQLEPKPATLIVSADGHAPASRELTLEPGMAPLDFVLGNGRTFSGRVLEGTQAVAGASVRVLESAGGARLPSWSSQTDAHGRFSWNSGPETQVQFIIIKQGFQNMQVGLDPSDAFPTIQLIREAVLVATVVDAETGKPIPEFELMQTANWPASDATDDIDHWENGRMLRGTGGSATLRLENAQGFANARVLARAEGYVPAATPVFNPAQLHEYTFKLIKGKELTGIVFGPGHLPAEGASVAILGLGTLTLGKDGLQAHGPLNFSTRTTAHGEFRLPPFLASAKVIAVHDAGFAKVDVGLLNITHEIELEPWGRVEGVLKNGTRPAANEALLLTPPQLGPAAINYDFEWFRKITDSNGRFAFDRVPPGPNRLVRLISMGRGWRWSDFQPIQVQPGKVLQVVSGGVGRPVTGKFALASADQNPDWNQGHHYLNTRSPRPPQQLTPEQLREWRARPEVLQAQRESRNYGFEIQMDGSFRIENVRPGDYTLGIQLHEPAPNQFGFGRMIAQFQKEISIAEIPGGVSDEPLDLGLVSIEPRKQLSVGDAAPDFEVPGLDEPPVKLSAFRGKYVFLDFWATWCGPCVAEIPNVKSAFAALEKTQPFVLISLSLDQDKETPAKFVQAHGMKWHHGFVNGAFQGGLPGIYGVDAIPSTFLINPSGKIIARNLRGPTLRQSIEKAIAADTPKEPRASN